MGSRSTSQNIRLDDLVLDINNPRFAELYSGSKSEDDLIEYLLYTEAAEEVAEAIVKAGEFYPDRPLWVIKEKGKYIVKDGNRRCAAVKALQMPGKYKLSHTKTIFTELPVLLYKKQTDIDERIVEEHAGNLFRRWERIAKALEVLKLADLGEDIREMDSKPGDLIKLATFYKEAVKIGGDDLKQLLRRGRGKTGGKTIIFERLFRDRTSCGYKFKDSPSYKIEVTDSTKFQSYVKAIVNYLKANGDNVTTETIDKNRLFLSELKSFGFDAYPVATTTSAGSTGTGSTSTTGSNSTGGGTTSAGSNPITATSSNGVTTSGGSAPASAGAAATTGGAAASATGTAPKRGSIKKVPTLLRKKLPAGLKSRIDEYFAIDANIQPNAKMAMARVTFECVLKYIIENTTYNGKTNMSKSSYFQPVYKGVFANFTLMKTKFTDLIKTKGVKSAFTAFDLEGMHTIVHNYRVNATPHNGEQISNNLMVLIEIMLQDDTDLLDILDLTLL